MIPYNTLELELKGEIDYVDDPFKALLLKDTTPYTPDPQRDTYVSDVLDNVEEYDDTNYQRITVDNRSVVQNNTLGRAEWRANDLEWPSLGSNVGQLIQGLVIYKEGADDTDSEVIRVIDDSNDGELPIPTNGTDIILEWNVDGIRTASEN